MRDGRGGICSDCEVRQWRGHLRHLEIFGAERFIACMRCFIFFLLFLAINVVCLSVSETLQNRGKVCLWWGLSAVLVVAVIRGRARRGSKSPVRSVCTFDRRGGVRPPTGTHSISSAVLFGGVWSETYVCSEDPNRVIFLDDSLLVVVLSPTEAERSSRPWYDRRSCG